MQEANLRGHGIRRGAARDLQGRSRSDIFWRVEEAALGLDSGHGAPLETEGKDPVKLWIPEEINRRRQKDDPPCKSGIAHEECRQEKFEQGQV
jgi:hypothetical protein